jgi:hypothetical protein
MPLDNNTDHLAASSTRATIQTKHVQFASPPAPETPLSYSYPSTAASSPESVRHAGPPTSSFNHPTEGVPAPADPFHSDDSDTSNERSDEGHNRVVRAEPAITPRTAQHGLNWHPAELQSLSSSAAAAIEAPSADGGSITRNTPAQVPGRGKQAIDVDAFKRLLLTGESGREGSGGAVVPPVSAIHSIIPGDSSSSTADSASVSRQSIFEPITSTSTDTPRTSHELDFDDASVERRSMYSPTTPQARQKPSVPKTRHGKPLAETKPSTSGAITTLGIGDASSARIYVPSPQSPTTDITKGLNKPLPPPPPPVDSSFPMPKIESPKLETVLPARAKRPPTPPLARRQSQMKGKKPQPERNSSSIAFAVEDPSPSSPTDLQNAPSTMKAPPPPPQRNSKRASTYGTPSSEPHLPISDSPRRPSASFLADLNTGIDRAGQRVAELPSRTPSSASRASTSLNSTSGPGAPPPLPPPRRMRGLSRSSTDSQRPASSELRRPSTESSRNVSGQSNATDILADLAALQREVDALRDNHGGGRGS